MYAEPASIAPASFQGLDPRARLLACAGAAVIFSLVQTVPAALLCLPPGLVLILLGRPRPLPLLRRLLTVNLFILFIWLTVPPTMHGETLFSLGSLHFSKEGLRLSLLVTLKCNAILLCLLALVSGISIPLIGCSLERLRVPAKLVFVFLFTCRYIHVIGEEWHKLRTAAGLRGFIPRSSLHTYRTIANMLGLVLINSFDRSRRIYEAMLLRGFEGSFHTVTELRGSRRDLVFVLLFFCLLLGLLVSDLYFGNVHG